MNNKTAASGSDPRTSSCIPAFSHGLKKRCRAAALAICVVLPCAPLLAAEELDDVARANSISTPQSPIQWMSGGIGDEARDDMRKAADGYNVHLLFSDRQGAYLAGIPFTVSQPNGYEIYSGVSEGPLLYLKLPRGTYKVSAKIDGEWQSKRVRAASAGGFSRTSFIARGD